MDVDLSGIYVDRVVPASAPKHIDNLRLRDEQENVGSDLNNIPPVIARRQRIARRAALELKTGFYCNLGIGMPVLAASFLPPGSQVWLQSENGILGMGPYPNANEVDA